jgi:NAD(P)-dependent dehydrogenase (short-subunit alcohol dehydrogenase family)
MTRLAGQHALITGGGTGIGAAIARRLAAEGANVTLVGRRQEPLQAVAREIGGFALAADVTDRDALERAFAEAREHSGPLSILINNAGVAPSSAFAEVSPEEWRRTMAVNADAVFACCQLALPDLLAAEHGRIVTVASTAGLKGYAYTAPYVASKHAAVGLMRALAAEFARTRLTANAVCPGFTDTAIVDSAAERIEVRTGRSEAEARAALARFNPQNRLVAPEEVAEAVLFLCLPESRGITGRALPVDGGEVA